MWKLENMEIIRRETEREREGSGGIKHEGEKLFLSYILKYL